MLATGVPHGFGRSSYELRSRWLVAQASHQVLRERIVMGDELVRLAELHLIAINRRTIPGQRTLQHAPFAVGLIAHPGKELQVRRIAPQRSRQHRSAVQAQIERAKRIDVVDEDFPCAGFGEIVFARGQELGHQHGVVGVRTG